MEGKLIKDKHINDFYYLMVGINTYATTHKESFRILSLKNCQAIELGYNLDELVKEQYPIDEPSFKRGFKLALELLGDKKFGVNEVVELCKILMSNPFEKCGKTYQELTDSYIQSLQQTEWDCIIEMDTDCTGEFKYLLLDKGTPKLDADGCLILKRK